MARIIAAVLLAAVAVTGCEQQQWTGGEHATPTPVYITNTH